PAKVGGGRCQRLPKGCEGWACGELEPQPRSHAVRVSNLNHLIINALGQIRELEGLEAIQHHQRSQRVNLIVVTCLKQCVATVDVACTDKSQQPVRASGGPRRTWTEFVFNLRKRRIAQSWRDG